MEPLPSLTDTEKKTSNSEPVTMSRPDYSYLAGYSNPCGDMPYENEMLILHDGTITLSNFPPLSWKYTPQTPFKGVPKETLKLLKKSKKRYHKNFARK